MNSRDAEYDDEVLKRMLEVSKHETKTNGESGSRRGRKRGSSEGSDEYASFPSSFALGRANHSPPLQIEGSETVS